MRVIVYPHELIIGGSPINAIDLAATVADLGHEVLIYGVPGPLIDYIEEKGLRFVPAHPLKYRPAPTRILELARLARREHIDLVHAYEWPPCLDAYYGPHLLEGVPVICSVLSMALVPLVPDSVPLIMGTRQLQESARVGRRGPVILLEPPVDTDADNPGVDGAAYRRQLGITDGDLLLVTVSRLSVDLKLDALVRAIDAVTELAHRMRVRLVLVGTGDAADQLQCRAERVNTALGREVVTLVGPTLDPRPAYAAADVVLGMGSSALRAMAFGKPVVVQGERGFSLVFGPDTFDSFCWQGFFGVGKGQTDNDLLTSQIAGLLGDRERRAELGLFGRRTVEDHYSLHAAATTLLERYAATALVQRPSGRRLATEAARVAGRAAANELRLHLPSDKQARLDGQQRHLAAAAGQGQT